MFDESDKHRYEAQLKANEDLRKENAQLREAMDAALKYVYGIENALPEGVLYQWSVLECIRPLAQILYEKKAV